MPRQTSGSIKRPFISHCQNACSSFPSDFAQFAKSAINSSTGVLSARLLSAAISSIWLGGSLGLRFGPGSLPRGYIEVELDSISVATDDELWCFVVRWNVAYSWLAVGGHDFPAFEHHFVFARDESIIFCKRPGREFAAGVKVGATRPVGQPLGYFNGSKAEASRGRWGTSSKGHGASDRDGNWAIGAATAGKWNGGQAGGAKSEGSR